eukprot:Ihof_evm8s7 gene=Ihof_evmTU8s7
MALTLVWQRELPFNHLSLAVGTPFSAKSCRILVGGEDGIIRMFVNSTDPPLLFETKGNAVCQLLLHNITKLHTTDLIVGDSAGSVSVFSKEQLLSRSHLPCTVTALAVCCDGAQNSSIVAGDVGGIVAGFLPFEQHWRVSLLEQNISGHLEPFYQPTVKALLNVVLYDDYGCPSHYLAVADGSKNIHFFQSGRYVFSLPVPCAPNTMCFGLFFVEDSESIGESQRIESENSMGGGETTATSMSGQVNQACQIAFAGDDGKIYLIHNYKVHLLDSIGYPIISMVQLHHGDSVDYLICAGAFAGVKILHQGK